jgi:hypothetical protein
MPLADFFLDSGMVSPGYWATASGEPAATRSAIAVTVVLGAQGALSGKGRVFDILAPRAKLLRFLGGQ